VKADSKDNGDAGVTNDVDALYMPSSHAVAGTRRTGKSRDGNRALSMTEQNGTAVTVHGTVGQLGRTLDTQSLWTLLSMGGVHPQRAISHPNDPAEREADRISQEITSPGADCNGCKADAACVKCASDGTLQRLHNAGTAPGASDLRPVGTGLGLGQPLGTSTRDFFEERLGVPLDDVRVHSDQRAGASAQGVGALAYTFGRDVVFAPGLYAPDTRAGTRLLAHELAHVVQQRAQDRTMLQRQAGGAAPGPNLPGCKDLLALIKEAVAELISRAADLVNDPLGLQWDNWNVPKIMPDGTNVGSVAGHQQQYGGWRNRLRNLIGQWDDDDCNQTGLRVPQDARDLQFKPVPAPTPRPRPAPEEPKPWQPPGAHRVGAAAKGAAIGAGAGLVLGGVIGAILGGTGGTFVAPGVGTIGVGAAGALAGAEAGAPIGAAIGTAIGGLIGWLSGE
jgi:uncharacterized protein DUF4157